MKAPKVSLSFVMLFVLATLPRAFSQVTSVAAGTGMNFPTITTTGTVSIDTTKVPLLANPNTFTASQTVNGNLTVTGIVNGGFLSIGGFPFASGAYTTGNASLGFAGRGGFYDNTMIGLNALGSNGGSYDTAAGAAALLWNTSGNYNTGMGYGAGNTTNGAQPTGSNNTFLGALTSPGTQTSLNNATAIGAYAEVSASNAMVLGSINGVNTCTAANKCTSTLVGIGTTTPVYLLHIGNSGGASFNNFLRVEGPTTAGTGGNAASFGGLGAFSIDAPNVPGGRFLVTESGRVGIGVEVPGHPLDMADHAYEDHGVWTNASDRNLKAGFAPVDGADLLVRLNAVPMSKWRYKSERESIRHIGPMAQDFYAAFGLGSDDKHITTVDEGGVALAAVQALYRENLKLFEATKQQQMLIQKQQAQIARLSQGMKTIQAALKTGRTSSVARTVKAKATVLHQ